MSDSRNTLQHQLIDFREKISRSRLVEQWARDKKTENDHEYDRYSLHQIVSLLDQIIKKLNEADANSKNDSSPAMHAFLIEKYTDQLSQLAALLTYPALKTNDPRLTTLVKEFLNFADPARVTTYQRNIILINEFLYTELQEALEELQQNTRSVEEHEALCIMACNEIEEYKRLGPIYLKELREGFAQIIRQASSNGLGEPFFKFKYRGTHESVIDVDLQKIEQAISLTNDPVLTSMKLIHNASIQVGKLTTLSLQEQLAHLLKKIQDSHLSEELAQQFDEIEAKGDSTESIQRDQHTLRQLTQTLNQIIEKVRQEDQDTYAQIAQLSTLLTRPSTRVTNGILQDFISELDSYADPQHKESYQPHLDKIAEPLEAKKNQLDQHVQSMKTQPDEEPLSSLLLKTYLATPLHHFHPANLTQPAFDISRNHSHQLYKNLSQLQDDIKQSKLVEKLRAELKESKTPESIQRDCYALTRIVFSLDNMIQFLSEATDYADSTHKQSQPIFIETISWLIALLKNTKIENKLLGEFVARLSTYADATQVQTYCNNLNEIADVLKTRQAELASQSVDMSLPEEYRTFCAHASNKITLYQENYGAIYWQELQEELSRLNLDEEVLKKLSSCHPSWAVRQTGEEGSSFNLLFLTEDFASEEKAEKELEKMKAHLEEKFNYTLPAGLFGTFDSNNNDQSFFKVGINLDVYKNILAKDKQEHSLEELISSAENNFKWTEKIIWRPNETGNLLFSQPVQHPREIISWLTVKSARAGLLPIKGLFSLQEKILTDGSTLQYIAIDLQKAREAMAFSKEEQDYSSRLKSIAIQHAQILHSANDPQTGKAMSWQITDVETYQHAIYNEEQAKAKVLQMKERDMEYGLSSSTIDPYRLQPVGSGNYQIRINLESYQQLLAPPTTHPSLVSGIQFMQDTLAQMKQLAQTSLPQHLSRLLEKIKQSPLGQRESKATNKLNPAEQHILNHIILLLKNMTATAPESWNQGDAVKQLSELAASLMHDSTRSKLQDATLTTFIVELSTYADPQQVESYKQNFDKIATSLRLKQDALQEQLQTLGSLPANKALSTAYSLAYEEIEHYWQLGPSYLKTLQEKLSAQISKNVMENVFTQCLYLWSLREKGTEGSPFNLLFIEQTFASAEEAQKEAQKMNVHFYRKFGKQIPSNIFMLFSDPPIFKFGIHLDNYCKMRGAPKLSLEEKSKMVKRDFVWASNFSWRPGATEKTLLSQPVPYPENVIARMTAQGREAGLSVEGLFTIQEEKSVDGAAVKVVAVNLPQLEKAIRLSPAENFPLTHLKLVHETLMEIEPLALPLQQKLSRLLEKITQSNLLAKLTDQAAASKANGIHPDFYALNRIMVTLTDLIHINPNVWNEQTALNKLSELTALLTHPTSFSKIEDSMLQELIKELETHAESHRVTLYQQNLDKITVLLLEQQEKLQHNLQNLDTQPSEDPCKVLCVMAQHEIALYQRLGPLYLKELLEGLAYTSGMPSSQQVAGKYFAPYNYSQFQSGRDPGFTPLNENIIGKFFDNLDWRIEGNRLISEAISKPMFTISRMTTQSLKAGILPIEELFSVHEKMEGDSAVKVIEVDLQKLDEAIQLPVTLGADYLSSPILHSIIEKQVKRFHELEENISWRKVDEDTICQNFAYPNEEAASKTIRGRHETDRDLDLSFDVQAIYNIHKRADGVGYEIRINLTKYKELLNPKANLPLASMKLVHDTLVQVAQLAVQPSVAAPQSDSRQSSQSSHDAEMKDVRSSGKDSSSDSDSQQPFQSAMVRSSLSQLPLTNRFFNSATRSSLVAEQKMLIDPEKLPQKLLEWLEIQLEAVRKDYESKKSPNESRAKNIFSSLFKNKKATTAALIKQINDILKLKKELPVNRLEKIIDLLVNRVLQFANYPDYRNKLLNKTKKHHGARLIIAVLAQLYKLMSEQNFIDKQKQSTQLSNFPPCDLKKMNYQNLLQSINLQLDQIGDDLTPTKKHPSIR